jgi:hypothetical protein
VGMLRRRRACISRYGIGFAAVSARCRAVAGERLGCSTGFTSVQSSVSRTAPLRSSSGSGRTTSPTYKGQETGPNPPRAARKSRKCPSGDDRDGLVWSGRHRRPGPWALPLPFNPIKADRMSHGRRKTLTGSRSLHVLVRPFCPSLVAGTTDCTGKISPPTREGQEGGPFRHARSKFLDVIHASARTPPPPSDRERGSTCTMTCANR